MEKYGTKCISIISTTYWRKLHKNNVSGIIFGTHAPCTKDNTVVKRIWKRKSLRRLEHGPKLPQFEKSVYIYPMNHSINNRSAKYYINIVEFIIRKHVIEKFQVRNILTIFFQLAKKCIESALFEAHSSIFQISLK